MTQALHKPPGLCYRAVEFRAETGGDGHTLEGYAAVFDTPARIDSWEGTFDEVIKRGAFAKTIQSRMPVLQFDHGHDARTGTVPIGAIDTLEEHRKGLFVRARLFENNVVEPIRQAIAGGAIDGMSFRFKVVRERWTDVDNKQINGTDLQALLCSPGERGPLKRQILEVQLFELGPVVFPAYDSTTVGVRSLLASLADHERESLIRELAAEVRLATDLSDPNEPSGDTSPDGEEQDPGAAPEGTPGDQDPDAGQEATSGSTPGERAAALRQLDLTRRAS